MNTSEKRRKLCDWMGMLLAERFATSFRVRLDSKGRVAIHIEGVDGKILIDSCLSDFYSLKTISACSFLSYRSSDLFEPLDLVLPALEVPPTLLVEEKESDVIINYDLFGLIFWVLGRCEEVGSGSLDQHDRFQVANSHAFKNGYLSRPIIDEWMLFLSFLIKRVWPSLPEPVREFKQLVSHDVDSPSYYGFAEAKRLLRYVAGELIVNKNFHSLYLAPWIRAMTRKSISKHDPHNTFQWIMDLSEKYSLQSAFYFICGGNSSYDADYTVKHPAIRDLIRNIHERGHEIGLHGSYESYTSLERVTNELSTLKKVMAEEGLPDVPVGGRMHYLRWQQPDTLTILNEAGLAYDCTLGYAETPGFRCGTCFEYPAFDPIKMEMLDIRIRPLIVMECSVVLEKYMGFGASDKAHDEIVNYKRTCRQYGGNFTLLWHNSFFTNPDEKALYESILQA